MFFFIKLFHFNETICTKTIIINLFYKYSFISGQSYSITLALSNVTWFTLKSAAASWTTFYFVFCILIQLFSCPLFFKRQKQFVFRTSNCSFNAIEKLMSIYVKDVVAKRNIFFQKLKYAIFKNNVVFMRYFDDVFEHFKSSLNYYFNRVIFLDNVKFFFPSFIVIE